jgi:hypothetical protein
MALGHRGERLLFRCCSSLVLCGRIRSRQRYSRVSLLLPSSISNRSSSAVAGYQRCSTANSLPGAHNRLIASTAATRDHGARAVGAVELVQDREFPARSDFEDSPVIRWAVFKRGAIDVSVGAERESAGRICSGYSVKAVKYGDLASRSDLENCTTCGSSSLGTAIVFMKKLHTIVLISLITISCFAGNIAESAALADAQDVTDRAIRIYADIDLKDYSQQKYMPVLQSCLKSTEHPDTSSVQGRVSTSRICSLLHAHDNELFQLNSFASKLAV